MKKNETAQGGSEGYFLNEEGGEKMDLEFHERQMGLTPEMEDFLDQVAKEFDKNKADGGGGENKDLQSAEPKERK